MEKIQKRERTGKKAKVALKDLEVRKGKEGPKGGIGIQIQIQDQFQDEDRQYTMVSNIMKEKHDTAKNAINNVR